MNKAKTDKKQQIMSAAESLFSNRRYHELTIDEVAKVGKVGKGTVYRYFKDKEDLFLQTAGWGGEELCESVEQSSPKGENFEASLLGICEVMGEFFSKRWNLFRVMQEQEQRGTWSKAALGQMKHGGDRLQLAIATVMKRGQKEGFLRKDLAAPVLAELFRGLLRPIGPVMWQMKAGKRYKLVVETFCRGVGCTAKETKQRSKK
jgi:AcrR family transcriptional regulator